MLTHLPHAIRRFESRHKPHLIFFGGKIPYEFMITLTFLTLPTIIALKSDTVTAGIIKSCALFFTAFIFAPIAGSLSDRWGALMNMRLAAGLSTGIALLWFITPLTTWSLGIILVLFYLRGQLNNTATYLLRITNKHDGGLIFGLSDNLTAFANFIAMTALPVFVLTGREKWAAGIMLATSLWYLFITLHLPLDLLKNKIEPHSKVHALNPFRTLLNGWHFIRRNHYYPLLRLTYISYLSLLKGVLWFILPIHFATQAFANDGSLALSIYELMPAFLAGIAGYMADRIKWQYIHLVGWLAIGGGMLLLPLDTSSLWLVGAGTVIAIGNNLANATATHVLEAQDHDHREDGAYMATESMTANGVEMLMPTLAGFSYSLFGLQTTLFILAGVVTLIVIAQLILNRLWRNKNA